MPAVYLCVSIDCECDKGPKWRCRKPMGFAGVHDGMAKRLHPLFVEYGAKPTYLLSPEVLRDDKCVETLSALEGCELGTHLHGEYAEPGAHEPDETAAFQRDYPPDIERQKLTYLTDLFRRAFGRAPRSFRAGRFGIGEHSLGILADLGYAVESSVTPHMDWSDVGAKGLAFLDAPTQPYHPDAKRPERVGASPLLEVPVTIRPRAIAGLPFVGRVLEPRWLRPTKGSGEALVRLAREEIADARAKAPARPVVLNAMLHNVEIVPGMSPYAQTEAEAEGILGRLRALLNFARAEGIRVVGLGDVPELLS
jgi:hypothetical protein